MKNNYPIKYAAMPIYEQTGWNHGLNSLERNYDVVAYIVSKCYLINENKEYKMDGKIKNNYEVVFPYSNSVSNHYNEYKRKEPEYDINYQCSNSIVVKNVFDTYEEATKEVKKLNSGILNKQFLYLSSEEFLENHDKLIHNHNEKLENYKLLEETIKKHTEDLDTYATTKEQSIIVVQNGKSKLINHSIYQYIQFISDYSFTVFNVNVEDYEKIKGQIKNEEQLDKKYSNCLMVNDKTKIDIINYNNSNNVDYALINDYGNINMYPFPDQNNNIAINENMVIYTMETYEDIINSYFKYDSIDIDKIIKEKIKVIKK